MRLAIRRTYFGDRLCLAGVLAEQLVDLRAAYALRLEVDGAHREDALARAERELPPTLPALLRADPALTLAREINDWALARSTSGDLHADCTWSGSGARLAAPTGRPQTVWGMTGNYPRHSGPNPNGDRDGAAPGKRAMSGFLKAAGAIVGPHDPVDYPAIAERVDPEMELGVVIGARCRDLTEDNAMAAVAGYVGFCDIGSRDISSLDNNRMDRAKGFDTFGIVGPVFVTKDEIPDPHALAIRFWINDGETQDGNTAQMLHSIPEQLAWLTAALTLAPGDILSTGTPPGVQSIHPGDRIRGEIDGLGVIESDVVAARDRATADRTVANLAR
jgi:2-keto-4-pentenoate hydratase/2-oxohepta-3-ene-1,7-dioic acid hydratase in catechol pathway